MFLLQSDEFRHHLNMMTEFVPHKTCWLDRADIIMPHAFGDGLTALAYYAIPATLIWILYRYKFGWQLKSIFGVYSLFILLCGTTHLLDVLMIWYINESIILFDGYLRVLTGIVSVFAFGVTVFAAINFSETFDQLILIKEQMEKERREFKQVSQHLVDKFVTVVSDVQQYVDRTPEGATITTTTTTNIGNGSDK